MACSAGCVNGYVKCTHGFYGPHNITHGIPSLPPAICHGVKCARCGGTGNGDD